MIKKIHLDLLKQYGPELVGQAVDEVADYVGDVDEIGSSDVSAWVNQVERMLKSNPPEAFSEGATVSYLVDIVNQHGDRGDVRVSAMDAEDAVRKVRQMYADSEWQIGVTRVRRADPVDEDRYAPEDAGPVESAITRRILMQRLDLLKQYNVQHPEIVLAQAYVESGLGKSFLFKANHNLFGMKQVYTRATTADTTINGYSHYANWRMSVIDYYIKQSTRESIIPTTREQYFHYLDKIYSEVGSSYSSQLKSIITRLGLDSDDPKPVLHHKKKKNKNSVKILKHKSKKLHTFNK